MSTVTRIKQALLVVGLLTVLGVLAMAGVVVYLWWDTKRDDEAFETGTEFDPETDVEAEDDTDAETDATAG